MTTMTAPVAIPSPQMTTMTPFKGNTMTTNFWRTIMTTFYLQNIKLITSKNKHRFVAPAGVKQLTKAQWEAFSNQAS